jgi:hypothetical protein
MCFVRIALSCAILVAAVAAAEVGATGAVASSGAAAHPGHGDYVKRQLAAVRRATAPYKDVRRARQAGYVGSAECVSSPEGGMGFHYAHPGLSGDRRFDIRRPEILVYEKRDGRMRLVAVEYFRADADQDLSTDDDRPHLFGRPFDGPMEGHEPGMPIHYDLHAWVWKKNPQGVFEQWNPRVHC